MVDDEQELQEIRKRKLQQMQMSQDQEERLEEEKARLEEQKKVMLRKALTDEARERLGRLRIAYPDLAANVEQNVIMLHQSGRLPGRIDDETLKKLLAQLQPKKREINIVRK